MSMRSGATASLALAWRAAPAPYVGYALASVGSGLAPVAAAWLTKLVLDRLAAGSGGLVLPAIGLAVTGLAIAVLRELTRYLAAEVSRRVTVLSRDRLYEATDRMTGLAKLEDPAFRDTMRLAEQHSQSGPMTILEALIGGLQAMLTVTGFTLTLIAISPWMAVVVLAASAPGLYAELQLSRRRAELMTGLSPTERRQYFYSELMTGLEAAKEIRLLGLGRLFRRRMLGELLAANETKRRIDRRDLLIQGLLAALGAITAGGGLIWAVVAAGAGRSSVGDVAVFVAAVGGVQLALSAVIGNLGTAHHALLMFEHYQAVTSAGPVLPRQANAAPELRHGIEFRGVWFRYSDDHDWALRGLDLFIPFGQSTALVGHNGAGKSTLVKLLCRFYDPTCGAILWDGVDLRELDVIELRRRIGAVFQDFMCYELSAAENIALGAVDGADELPDHLPVAAAADRAGIAAVLAALPHGYQTLLSRMFFDQADKDDPTTGVLLSGGQWQRVALARAFLRDHRDLLILDEPTSGLDAEAEHEIHTSLAAHRAGRTSVLISHRLGAVRSADRIAVLVDGRIAELGAHETLIAQNGTYAHLFTLQASGYTAH